MPFHVLHVSSTDVAGGRFNGYSMLQNRSADFQAEMAVWNKTSDYSSVHSLRRGIWRWVSALTWRLGAVFALDNLLSLNGLELTCQRYFKETDLVHLQLFYNGTLSHLSLPVISHLKPTVWTLHDAWPTTGMCIHSFECEKWLTGCLGRCPHPRRGSALRYFTPALHWQIKKRIYESMKVTLVVASQWMYDRIARSPLLSHFPRHLIPFGIDINVFTPRNKDKARAKLGIPANAHVLAFRGKDIKKDLFKGTRWLRDALEMLQPKALTYLLILDEACSFISMADKYKIIQMGWIDDENHLAEILSAADLFLMPSVQEAFGLMAVEAMACKTPVIVFEGTALPDVIHAPHGGLVVPSKNSAELAKAIERLLDDDNLRLRMGEQARQIVEREYSWDVYYDRHLNLYKDVLNSYVPVK